MLFTPKLKQVKVVEIILLIGFSKELFHLLVLYGYFDITDIIFYLIGGLIGYYIHKMLWRQKIIEQKSDNHEVINR